MSAGPRTAGRPRDDSLDAAIMAAALHLVGERGYAAVTLDAIAEQACTSKTAIYRRWPKKAAIIMDAFLAEAEPLIQPVTGLPFRDTIIAQMTALTDFLQTTPGGRTLRGLIAEAQTDTALADAIRERWLAPRRAVAAAMYADAHEAGELRGDIDSGALVDALYGPLYFRLLLGHAPIDHAFIAQTVDTVLGGVKAH